MTDSEFKKKLTPEQYRILREQGTEAAFSGKYNKTKDTGMYLCAACGNELFDSDTKFDSGSGWPSFYQPVSKDKVNTEADLSMDMDRVEVKCAKCDSHLGHFFADGPKPTGQRFCINSASLDLRKK